MRCVVGFLPPGTREPEPEPGPDVIVPAFKVRAYEVRGDGRIVPVGRAGELPTAAGTEAHDEAHRRAQEAIRAQSEAKPTPTTEAPVVPGQRRRKPARPTPRPKATPAPAAAGKRRQQAPGLRGDRPGRLE